MAGTTSDSACIELKKLINPGPAISTLATLGETGKACTIFSAISRGLRCNGLAKTKAIFVAKSPCCLSLVVSICKGGIELKENSPWACNVFNAAKINSSRCCFIRLYSFSKVYIAQEFLYIGTNFKAFFFTVLAQRFTDFVLLASITYSTCTIAFNRDKCPHIM